MINNGNVFLTKYIGLMLIFTSIMRIILNKQSEYESETIFKLSKNFSIIIIIFELIIGIILTFDLMYKFNSLIILLLFLIIATIIILINNYNNIILTFTQVFIYSPTGTCVILHFTYIIILISILINEYTYIS